MWQPHILIENNNTNKPVFRYFDIIEQVSTLIG